MLFTIQFPIADSRKFLEIDTGMLNIPCWPTPIPDQDFIRYFGSVRQRKLGGIYGWIGESEICEAKRALRIINHSNILNRGPYFPKLNIDTVFRRFYFDGFAVGKYEIGLIIHTKKNRPLHFNQVESSGILEKILQLPVNIPQPNEKGNITCPLVKAGGYISNLFRLASTSTSFDKDTASWWVSSRRPIILMETQAQDSIDFPYWKRTIPTKEYLEQELIDYFLVPNKEFDIPLWLLRSPFKYGWDNSENKSQNRELRIILLRLHAERECLRKILANISSGNIRVARGTIASDNLQNFLNEAIRRVNNIEKRSTEFFFKNISEFAQYADGFVSPGSNDAILRSLKDIRLNILRKVENYIQQTNYFTEQTMGNKYINFGQAGIVGPDGRIENMQVVQIWNNLSDTLDLSDLANELSELKEAMTHQAETPEHELSIGAISAAQKAAKNGDGPKAIEYLKSAGKWSFDVATKIGIGVVTALIKSELGF
ncbi:MAG: hypothetical protein ACYC6K_05905 [Bellilinea sp.]